MLALLPLTLVLLLTCSSSYASDTPLNGPCDQADTKLETGTYQLLSSCPITQFCNSNGQCQDKGCRRDEFPFGYPSGGNLPPKCPQGQFCPDEEDACQPLLPVGSPCQLNRNDECEAPPDFKQLAGDLTQNFNGSVCINLTCQWANVTLGQPCLVENVAYIGYAADGSEFIDVVSRGNCVKGLYCDAVALQCMQTKALGASSDSPQHFGVWVYVVVFIAILGGMVGTLVTLFFIHRKDRDQDRSKRLQYWREQNAFRQNIMQMRDTARASILSLPRDGASTVGTNSPRGSAYSRVGLTSEDSSLPLVQHAASNPSGLRNQVSDDDRAADDSGEEALITTGKKSRRKPTRRTSVGRI
ncbi:hypothetical protein SISSUDRAFT_1067099 [Sistotremastrum suecicum HHB10207 ss-3]|uniref:Uncharacterized protein n=1 Tax=Sistotremastrum suecicum HHB10207 ss-3 TaxID=1314776 RepID=A0A165XIQ1_9AGAM|nr:hypothetical protein SISSUDRAFT_1067099 [Sistotremastrum suecicum HHB10207 ss-3]